MVISASFKIFLLANEVIHLAALSSILSLRNRVVRRRMCKITAFPLCYPSKWLLCDRSKVHSILKYMYTKRLMFEMWHSMKVFYYSSKKSRPIDVLRKFWIYCAYRFSKRRLIPLKRSWTDCCVFCDTVPWGPFVVAVSFILLSSLTLETVALR